jgi:hypothetical protein
LTGDIFGERDREHVQAAGRARGSAADFLSGTTVAHKERPMHVITVTRKTSAQREAIWVKGSETIVPVP